MGHSINPEYLAWMAHSNGHHTAMLALHDTISIHHITPGGGVVRGGWAYTLYGLGGAILATDYLGVEDAADVATARAKALDATRAYYCEQGRSETSIAYQLGALAS